MPSIGLPISLRAFGEGDYGAISGIRNAIYGSSYCTPHSIREEDQRTGGPGVCRWIATLNGETAAAGDLRDSPLGRDERVFDLTIETRPDCRDLGLGSALYYQLTALLADRSTSLVLSRVREDAPEGIRFLQQRGFVEIQRTWGSVLNVLKAPPIRIEEEARLKDLGISIKSIAELDSDPARDDKLFDLLSTLLTDVPMVMRRPRMTYDFFQRSILGNAMMIPDAFFVAVAGGIYVGTSNLFKESQSDALATRQTGVLREFRRRGVATELKKRGLMFAREHGYRVIRTQNDSNNLSVSRLNERLGFVKELAWITYEKPF